MPNEGSCQKGVALKCNDDGSAYLDEGEICGEEEACVAGACLPYQCEPAELFCSGGVVRACAEDGLSSEEIETCASDQYCDAESATCQQGSCSPNKPACDNDVATTCNADGSGFLAGGSVCAAGTTCENGLCQPHVCTQATTFCQGKDVKRCSDDGLTATLIRTCAPDEYCNAATAACAPRVCTPTTKECASGGVRTCNGDGSGWSSPVACGATQYCAAGTCKARVCTPNATECAGNAVRTCNNNGSAWLSPVSCPDSTPVCSNGQCGSPQSCDGLAASCGAAGNENCCTSILVPGGTFNRSNDTSAPAAVSSFRLDKFEVTRGRFRKFMSAVLAGWRPAAGSGKHTHLNGGKGLANAAGGFEAGARPEWGEPPSTDWGSYNIYRCGDPLAFVDETTDAATDTLPSFCVDWTNAAAFCIWDGGFLPSEAEWNYAAAGGSEQRLYPWGSGSPDGLIDDVNLTKVGVSSRSNARWGHANLAGNVEEWVLDAFMPYASPCNDCASLTEPFNYGDRVVRGGALGAVNDGAADTDVTTSFRDLGYVTARKTGLRCARVP